jgi:hypothetical protein
MHLLKYLKNARFCRKSRKATGTPIAPARSIVRNTVKTGVLMQLSREDQDARNSLAWIARDNLELSLPAFSWLSSSLLNHQSFWRARRGVRLGQFAISNCLKSGGCDSAAWPSQLLLSSRGRRLSLSLRDDRMAPFWAGAAQEVTVEHNSAKDDQKISMMVSNKLAARGLRAPCAVSVKTSNGVVTLSGTVVQAHQKNAATHAAAGIEGVKRVYDNLVVKVAAKRSDDKDGQWAMKPLKAPAAMPEAPLVDEATVAEQLESVPEDPQTN